VSTTPSPALSEANSTRGGGRVSLPQAPETTAPAMVNCPPPPVFVDATYCTAGANRRVVAQAVVVATGVPGDGRREVLGFAMGDSEDGAF
jgi:hypothetical protein